MAYLDIRDTTMLKLAVADGWPELLPELSPETPPPPDFPLDCLPPVLRDMTAGVSETTQTNPAMAGTMALACLAAAVAGKFEIEPKADYREPLNLYTLIAADPAERKSATLSAMTAPLYRFEREENARRAPEIQAYQDQRDALETELNAIKRDKKPDKAARMREKRQELEALSPVEPVRIIADDVTPETAASLLAENHGIISIFSAEGGLFGTLAGRYSNGQPNLSTFLKGHSGDPIRIDRRGRTESIESPAITCCLCVQIGVLMDVLQNKAFRETGLCARFLYCMPPSTLGQRNYITKPLDGTVRADYEALLYELLSLSFPYPQTIGLSESAQRESATFFSLFEKELGGSYQEYNDLAGKHFGATMRLAGLLHCALHGSDAANAELLCETLQNAIIVSDYYLKMGIAAYSHTAQSTAETDAAALVRRIREMPQHLRDKYTNRLCFTTSDFHHLFRCRRVKRAKDMLPILEELAACGYIRRNEDGNWQVHPVIVYGR